jgi:putative ABC transport system permease protein
VRALDVLGFAGNALLQHRRRTFLSLLGVAVGATAVVVLAGLGEGAHRFVLGEFASLGSNIIIVMPGRSETSGSIPGVGGAPNKLTLDDARALERSLHGVRRVIPLAFGNDKVAYLERRRALMVIGSTSGLLSARNLEMARGSFLPEGEMARGAPIAVIGDRVRRELFRDDDPVGKVIRVGDARMRVIGVLAPRGTQMGDDIDDTIIAPVATVMQIFNRSSLMQILVETNAYADSDLIKQQINDLITERHDEFDITCITQEAVIDALGSILRALTLAIMSIGGISLAVAGVGIMNVMLVSVAERTSEVGLLKAIGARPKHILSVFLTESALLSLAGGLVGLSLGVGILKIVVWLYPSLPAAAPLWAIASVLGLTTLTGPLFGVLPAWRAMQLDPVDALTRK